MSGWTREEDDRLALDWSAGLSCSQIAKQFRGRSRNAVIGRVHRLGLAARAPRTGAGRPNGAMAKSKPARSPINYTPLDARRRKLEIMRNPPAPKPVAENPQGRNKLLLTELPNARTRCRFPLWPNNAFPKDEEMFVCGEATEGETVYCEFHRGVCFNATALRDLSNIQPAW